MLGFMDMGGGMRDVYGAGVTDCFLDNGISFDYCIGVSAGCANIATFLAGQRGRNFRFYTDYALRKEYMSAENFIKSGSFFNLDYVYSYLSNSSGEDPLDFDAMKNNKSEFIVVATDAESGILKYEFYIDANNGDCGGKKCDSTQKSNPILKKTITTSSNSASFESSEYFDSSVEYIVKVYNKEGLSTTYSLNDNCSKSSTQCAQPDSNAYMTDKNFFGSSSKYMWTCSSGKTWCG